MQEGGCTRYVVGVGGGDALPGVAAGLSCRKIRQAEHGHEPGLAFHAMIGQGFAGPAAGDQDATAGVAEVGAAVCFAAAVAGPHTGLRVLGVDAVAEPVRAAGRAGLVAQCLDEPVGVRGGGCIALSGVDGAELLGQVFGEVADALAGVFRSGDDPLGVELGPEPGDVQRLIVRADGVEGVVPGREQLPGGRVEVPAGRFVPGRQLVIAVLELVRGWPPDLMVGGGDDLPQIGAGDGAADGQVDVRARRFCGSMVAKYWTSRPA